MMNFIVFSTNMRLVSMICTKILEYQVCWRRPGTSACQEKLFQQGFRSLLAPDSSCILWSLNTADVVVNQKFWSMWAWVPSAENPHLGQYFALLQVRFYCVSIFRHALYCNQLRWVLCFSWIFVLKSEVASYSVIYQTIVQQMSLKL